MIKDLRVIQNMVDMAVGIPRFTYQMNRNAPRPEGAYAAVRLRRTYKPGYDKLEYIPSPFGGLVCRATGLRILEVDVLFSRDDEDAEQFNNSFHVPSIREYLDIQGYALMGSNPLTIKDVKLESDWELRNGVTITLSTIRVTDTDVSEIKAVEVNGIYNEGTMEIEVGPIKVGEI